MIVDILIIVLLFSSIIRGKEIGFVQQAFSTIGFFGGLLLGTYLLPLTVKLAHTQLSRSVITLVTTLGVAFIWLTIGEYFGIFTKRKVVSLNNLNKFDNIFGSLISAASVLIGVWLGVAIIRTLPVLSFQHQINNSKIVATLDRHLPPAPNIIADLSHLVDPNGFPRVFNGNEPSPPGSVSLPAYSSIASAVNQDRASVVKIVGDGCGGVVEGSGFVVKNGVVATNAHVVAGIAQPYVQDSNGNHLATVIYFNPNLDFALLRVTGLAGTPLSVSSSTFSNNGNAAVLGYPGGGSFKANSAVVMQEFAAAGSNIYDQGSTNRQVYEVEANIIPGNSGGPLVAPNGMVVGVVFAQSTQYNHVGYALVSQQIVNIIKHTSATSSPVGDGTCAG